MDLARKFDSSQSSISSVSLNEEESDGDIIHFVDVERDILKKADRSENTTSSDMNKSPNLRQHTVVKTLKAKQLQLPVSKDFNIQKPKFVASVTHKNKVVYTKPVYYARKSNTSENSSSEGREVDISSSPNFANVTSPVQSNLNTSNPSKQTSSTSPAIKTNMSSCNTHISPVKGSQLKNISTKSLINPLAASKKSTTNIIPKIRFVRDISSNLAKCKTQKTESTFPREIDKEELIKNLLSISETEKQHEKTIESSVSSSNSNAFSDIPNLNSIEIIDDSCSGDEESSPKSPKTGTNKDSENMPNEKFLKNSLYSDATKAKAVTSGSTNITTSTLEVEKLITDKLTSVTTPTMLLPKVTKSEQLLLPKSVGTNATSSADASVKANQNISSIVTPSQGNVIVPSPLPTSINFVVPRTEIIRCKQANVPLILAVPPLLPSGSTPQAAGNLLMVLPSQLPQNIPAKGAVNFLVSTATVKGNANNLIQNIASRSQTSAKILGNIGPQGTSLNKNMFLASSLTAPTQVLRKEGEKITEQEESSLKIGHTVLNTKEKDGPVWCWYASKVGKRDLDGFLYKDRLGFSKGEVNQVKRCLKKLNTALINKHIELDKLGSKIVSLKQGYKFTRHGKIAKENISPQNFLPKLKSRVNQAPVLKNQATGIKRKFNDQSLNENNKENDTVSVPSSNSNSNFKDDDGSDLYYTKKVVILRNNAPKRRPKKPKRLPKIKLRSSYRKPALQKSEFKNINILPAVKDCRVIIERDPRVEEEFKKQTENSIGRLSRKRKLDLESMGLIKKVRRRNAIDSSVTSEVHIKGKSEMSLQEFGGRSVNIKDVSEESDSYIVSQNAHDESTSMVLTKERDHSDDSKGTQIDVKKNVSMSYREYQKLIKLSQTEVNFIFILNTVQSLDELKINEHKPLLILDRFSYKLDFDQINNFNVIFTRDDGEIIPTELLKNFEFVYYVRHGFIKVVSRPVLCKYILERNDTFQKHVKNVSSTSTEKQQLKSKKFQKIESKGDEAKERFVKTLSLTRTTTLDKNTETSTKSAVINVRQDLMQTSSTKTPIKKKITNRKKLPGKYGKPKTKEGGEKQNTITKEYFGNKEKGSSKLDIKFNEIENNLSRMFGKPRQSSVDVPNTSPGLICLTEFDHFTNVNNKNTMDADKIVNELSVDLDYLLSNSVEETVNLDNSSEETKIDIVQHIVTETDLSNKLIDGSPKKSKRNLSLSDKILSKKEVLNFNTETPAEMDNLLQNVQSRQKINMKDTLSVTCIKNKNDNCKNLQKTTLDNIGGSIDVNTVVVNDNIMQNNPEILQTTSKEKGDSIKSYQICTFANENEDNVFELVTDSKKPEALVNSTKLNKHPDEFVKVIGSGISNRQSDISLVGESSENQIPIAEKVETTSDIKAVKGSIPNSSETNEISEKADLCESSEMERTRDIREVKDSMRDSSETNEMDDLCESSSILTEILNSDCSKVMLETDKNNVENVGLADTNSASDMLETCETLTEKVDTLNIEGPMKKNDKYCSDNLEKISSNTIDVDQFLVKSTTSTENNGNSVLNVGMFLSKDSELAQASHINCAGNMSQKSDQVSKEVEPDPEEKNCNMDETSIEIQSQTEAVISKKSGLLEGSKDSLQNSLLDNTEILNELAVEKVDSSIAPDAGENEKSTLRDIPEVISELGADTDNVHTRGIQDTTPTTSFETGSSVLDSVINKNIICSTSDFDSINTAPNDNVDDTPQETSIFEDSTPSETNKSISHIKSDDTEKLLGENKIGEVDSELAVHGNEISKNLPDDYLEK